MKFTYAKGSQTEETLNDFNEASEICANCKFFLADEQFKYQANLHISDYFGPCRRYPPKLSDSVHRVMWQEKIADGTRDEVDAAYCVAAEPYGCSFPVVDGGAWCGEFVKAEAKN